MKRMFAGLLLGTVWFGLIPASATAARVRASSGDHDQVSFGQTITVDDAHPAKDVVCFFCTVHVRGDVSGDLVTFFGDVDVSAGRSVARDAVVFGGRLTLADEARVGRDLVVFGTDLNQAATSTVTHDRVVFAGSGWLLAMLLPLLIPIGLIWLIVRVVFRPRYRFPAYPGGQRF